VSGDLLRTVTAAARRAAAVRADRAAHGADAAAFDRAVDAATPRGAAFVAALRQPGIRVIAECKRRSPSRGVLRRDYDAAAVARSYEAAGAAAISVLTEPTFFDGSLDHLREVRAAVDLRLLRKDFIVTPFQIREARAAGADAVLLIVAALAGDELRTLLRGAADAGLAALVEVHDRAELERAVDAGAGDAGAVVVGVNSRNLRTLEVDTRVFDEVAARMPAGVVAVAESGLRSGDDLARLHALRYDAFLVGERLVAEPDPGAALAALRLAAEGAAPR
jgi:indole-3-glycerol phosphate synthase